MISIIVPVYKSEKTLQRCIHSLLEQTYPDIEIIMIVDGPMDQTEILADCLAEKNDKIQVIHQKNQGVSVSRNKGINHAKGDYVLFVDSDDYVEPTMCEKMLSTMEQNDSDMVLCGYHHWYFNKDVEKIPPAIGNFIIGNFIIGNFTTSRSVSLLLDLYKVQLLNMPWNKLFKKKFITENFPEDQSLGEDLIFNLNYLKNIQSFTIINDLLYHYIQDEKGDTLSTKRRRDRIETALFLYQYVSQFFLDKFKIEDSYGIFESKVVVEFLDDLESLYFQKDLSLLQRKQIIKTYGTALLKLPKSAPINLEKLDYKIIYFCLKRNLMGLTYFFIHVRGILVRFLRKRNESKISKIKHRISL